MEFTQVEMKFIARGLDREWDMLEDRLNLYKATESEAKIKEAQEKLDKVIALAEKVDEIRREMRRGNEA